MAGELWDLIEAHRRRIAPAVLSNRKIAEELGLSPSTPGNWSRGLKDLPKRSSLLTLSDLIRTPYEVVLNAALRDASYLPERAAREAEAGAEVVDLPRREDADHQAVAEHDLKDPGEEAEETERST